MIKVKLQYLWQPRPGDGFPVDATLFRALFAVHETGSIAGAARAVEMSYRHVWGLMRKWEKTFGKPLVVLRQGQGAQLTEFGRKLLWSEELVRARLTPDRTPFLPFLSIAVAAARAHGVAILDGVCNEFRDLAAFRAEAEQGLLFGFDGKSLIHPDQVGPCNEVFSPGEEEVRWAKAVIDAFALPENASKGAIRVEGKMAELLHLEQARRLVAVAERIAASG